MALMLSAAARRYCSRARAQAPSPMSVLGGSGLGDKIRVMIVDDHEVVRRELAAALGRCPAVDMVGATGCAEEATLWASERHPDVVLLDVKRDDGGGLDLCRRLTGHGHPR